MQSFIWSDTSAIVVNDSILATYSCSLLVFWPCSSPILEISPLSYHRVLLGPLDHMSWWLWQNPASDGQLWPPDISQWGALSVSGLKEPSRSHFSTVYVSFINNLLPLSRTVRFFFMIFPLKLPIHSTASSPTSNIPNSIVLSFCMVWEAELLGPQLRDNAEPLPSLGATESWQPSVSFRKCVRVIFLSKCYAWKT